MKFLENVHPPKQVTCHVSPVTCHMSCVTCHVSHFTYHVSHATFIYIFLSDKVVKLFGGGSVTNRASFNRPGVARAVLQTAL